MKKPLAFILLVLYLFSFSEFHQFLKAPVFFAHYSEHQLKDPTTTVWGFIKEHYQGKFELDDDYQRDNQLPFRTADCISNSLSAYEIPATIEVEIAEFKLQSEFILNNDHHIPHRSITDIFQPPRSC